MESCINLSLKGLVRVGSFCRRLHQGIPDTSSGLNHSSMDNNKTVPVCYMHVRFTAHNQVINVMNVVFWL